ncbi:MAG: D-aminoacyl-tRNA deacylase [Candidatus Aenigmatarchaeota archaeon]
MKALVVKIKKGEVYLKEKIVSAINKGIAVFVGIEKNDNNFILNEMAEKISNLRIFEDESGKLNYSVKEKKYEVLCISNFTLCANLEKGRRPSFEKAMPKEEANKIFSDFILLLKGKGLEVKTGVFGEYMDIRLQLDGPVNIFLEIPSKI